MESLRPALGDAPLQWVGPLSAIVEEVLYHFKPSLHGVMVFNKTLSCIEQAGSFNVDAPKPCYAWHTTDKTIAFLPYQGSVPSHASLQAQDSQKAIAYLWSQALGARAHRIVEACRLLILLSAEPFCPPDSVINGLVFASSQQALVEQAFIRQALPLNLRPLYALTQTCLIYANDQFQPPSVFLIDRPTISAHERLTYHLRLETLLASEPWDPNALLESLKA